MSTALAIPTTRELEAWTPAERWQAEQRLDEVHGALRDFNDAELRQWVEAEGKTQAEIAELVGLDQSNISRRCHRLGIEPTSNRGRPRNMQAHKSEVGPAVDDKDDDEFEVVEGEVVEDAPAPPLDPATPDPGPRVACPTCGHMVKPSDVRAWRE